MMINKRLIGTVRESKKYVAGNVILQWCSLIGNIVMMTVLTYLLASLYAGTADTRSIAACAVTAFVTVLIRFVCTIGSSRMGYLSSRAVKKNFREQIYKRFLRLGASYNEQVKTSEIVPAAVILKSLCGERCDCCECNGRIVMKVKQLLLVILGCICVGASYSLYFTLKVKTIKVESLVGE